MGAIGVVLVPDGDLRSDISEARWLGSHVRERNETHTDIRSTLRGKVQSLALLLDESVSASLSNSPRLFWDK